MGTATLPYFMSQFLRFLPFAFLVTGLLLGLGAWQFRSLGDWSLWVSGALVASSFFLWMIHARKELNPGRSWLSWSMLLITIRLYGVLLEPHVSIQHSLFSHRFAWFAHTSYFSVYFSLIVLILILGYGIWHLPKLLDRFQWRNLNPLSRIVWMIGLLWLSFWTTEMVLWFCRDWFISTGKTFLYYQILDPYQFWFYTGIIIFLFTFHHLLFQISQSLFLSLVWRILLFVFVPLFWIGIHFYYFKFWPISVVMILVWIIQCSFSLPVTLYQIRLKSYFYLILFASVVAGMLSWYAADLHVKQQKIVKEAFIRSGKETRQPKIENILIRWTQKWSKDSTIQAAITKEFLTTERITTHLQTNYLESADSLSYLQVVDTLFSSPPGLPITPEVYFEDPYYWVQLGKSWWIRYLPGQDPITLSNLWQKAETQFKQGIYSFENYHLALWDGNQRRILESKGLFPFQDRTFIDILRSNSKLNFLFQGYAVQVIPIRQNIHWIFAESRWGRWDRMASFGALFMISVFQILVVFLSLWLVLQSRFINQIGFSSRIQLFIQFAFLIPLFLLTFILYRLFDKGLSETQSDSQIQVTKNIAQGIQKNYQLWVEGKVSRGVLKETFQRISANRDQPMTLYDLTGQRITHEGLDVFTSPIDFPLTTNQLVIRQVHQPQYGYRATAVFYPLMTRFNQPMGWLKIDFVDAPLQLDIRKRYLLRSVLVMFVVLFGFLCTSAYWMATFLTDPLHVLANRLLGLSLERTNERLPDDMTGEIGTLTRSYNQMLEKLEESKQALARSEKQAAWQEVAKQVVHEIKNPLTPMKLQVQQMLRQIPEDTSQEEPLKRKKALLQLIDKIDHLSDIALSFTQFADLEVPQSIRFNLTEWFQKLGIKSLRNVRMVKQGRNTDEFIWVNLDPIFLEKTIHQVGIFFDQNVKTPVEMHVRIEVSPYFAQIVMYCDQVELSEKDRETLFLPKITENSTQFGLAMAKKGMESSGGNLWFGQYGGLDQVFVLDIPLS